MSTKLRRFLITFAASAGTGVLATAVIASGDNGYSASFIVLPILVLELLVCLILFVVGIVYIAQDKLVGFYLLLAVLLLPSTTIGSALLAKKLEIGAYRVEPMRPIIPPIANKIVFKKGVRDNEVQGFWHDVLSHPREDGRRNESTRHPINWHRPYRRGIRGHIIFFFPERD